MSTAIQLINYCPPVEVVYGTPPDMEYLTHAKGQEQRDRDPQLSQFAGELAAEAAEVALANASLSIPNVRPSRAVAYDRLAQAQYALGSVCCSCALQDTCAVRQTLLDVKDGSELAVAALEMTRQVAEAPQWLQAARAEQFKGGQARLNQIMADPEELARAVESGELRQYLGNVQSELIGTVKKSDIPELARTGVSENAVLPQYHLRMPSGNEFIMVDAADPQEMKTAYQQNERLGVLYGKMTDLLDGRGEDGQPPIMSPGDTRAVGLIRTPKQMDAPAVGIEVRQGGCKVRWYLTVSKLQGEGPIARVVSLGISTTDKNQGPIIDQLYGKL